MERALDELLRRLHAEDEEREARIDQILRDIHDAMGRPGGRLLTDDDLYDEMGLPR